MTLQISNPPIDKAVRPMRDDSTTAEERLKKTLFIVEATSFEQHTLWGRFAKDSRDRPGYVEHPVAWEQINPGWNVDVGSKTHVSMSWARIDGHLICFYEPVSQVVDNKAVEDWFKKHFKGRWDSGTRRATTNASNFHHALHAVREANTPAVDKYPDLPWVEESIYHDRIRGLPEQGKKVVVLATQWGPVGADNPTMQYKYRVEDEDPIEAGPYYTELETPQLLELAARIRPVYRPKDDSDLYYLEDHPLTIAYLRNTAFLWDPKKGKPAKGLQIITTIKTYHSWAYYGFFKPDIAETLAQIPSELLNRVCAFEITNADLSGDQKAFDTGYHTATTVLYELA